MLYTAPTAIRAFMKQGEELPRGHDLSSLRLLGSVGEPINPEAWLWYHVNIGGERCPIVDTWWQTETGQILITPLPGVTETKPGSATFPFPGIQADVVDSNGDSVPLGQGGYLVLKRPWPAMLRGIYGDPDRYRATYWGRFPGMYFAGDGAKRDGDGYFWLLGRVDDVMNVAGHRISTIEVESALVDHPVVAEAAVVGKEDPVSGQAIFAFVTVRAGVETSDELAHQLREHVARVIGPIARPRYLLFTPDLPKTRSGKIMRRLLRDVAEGRTLGDTTTLADAGVVESHPGRCGLGRGGLGWSDDGSGSSLGRSGRDAPVLGVVTRRWRLRAVAGHGGWHGRRSRVRVGPWRGHRARGPRAARVRTQPHRRVALRRVGHAAAADG